MTVFDPRAGARSLIEDAIGAKPGDSLAIVAEDPGAGVYDVMVPLCVADVAADLGVEARIIPVDAPSWPQAIPPAVAEALQEEDHVLFHARLGDTLRFSEIPGGASKTMSYALDISFLGSPACTVPHRVLEEIRSAYNEQVDASREWHITCPNGTDLRGIQDVEKVQRGEAEDFTVTRYPVCAPRPLACDRANGVVAVAHWLMASGHSVYPDDKLLLPEPLMAQVEDGRILDFEGPSALRQSVLDHYRRVGDFLGIDALRVHSWHAGLNPGCGYPVKAALDLERWGRVAFANPRYLHFHTCGNYAPGEIAWSHFDASASFDGRDIWRDGHCVFLDSPEVREILDRNGIAELEIVREIGI